MCILSIAVNSLCKLYLYTIQYIHVQYMYLVLVLLQETITHFDYRLCRALPLLPADFNPFFGTSVGHNLLPMQAYIAGYSMYPLARTLCWNLEQSVGARNRVGIWLLYRPARLHRLAESLP